MFKYRRNVPYIGQEEKDAIAAVIDSGMVVRGEVTDKFEKMFAELMGKKYAVALSSCTVGLQLALQVLRKYVDTNDVIIPDYTFLATGNAVLNVGMVPSIVDVDVSRYNVTARHIVSRIEKYPTILMPVHALGNPCSVEKDLGELNQDSFFIVEDAACAVGSNGIGYGDIQVFSFHGAKIITTGVGGMLTTDNKEWTEEILRLVRADRPYFTRQSYNYQISDINSAMGIEQLKKLSYIVQKRREFAQRYNDLLKGFCSPQETSGSNYQSYVVLVDKKKRDKIVEYLKGYGIEAGIGTYSLTLIPYFKQYGDWCGNGNYIFRTQICLPLYPTLTENDQNFIVERFKEAVKDAT